MVHHAKKEHVDILIVFLFALSFLVSLPVISFFITTAVDTVVTESPSQAEPASIFNKKAFNALEIEGRAYVVYDITHHEIIAAKNETTIFPLASLTKVMMAVSSLLHNAKEDTVTIKPESIEDGYDLGLRKNQVWELSELLKYVLVFSSNDGAEAIADTFGGKENFIAQMNSDAKMFGLNFLFTDPAGRDVEGKIGGSGNALDAAKLFGIAQKNIPEILDATTKKRQTVKASGGKISGIPNTNQEIENLPGVIASKTGYTDLAGGNLGIIVDVSVGRPVAIIVLGSTRQGRFKDVSVLYDALRKSLETSTHN